jgi:1-acyl-sn-glycerol-3-phosphate acyltransferase
MPQSYLKPRYSAMCVLVKNDCCFMGKGTGRWPGNRSFFRTVDIPVNRESKMSSYRAFKKAVERIKAGITLVIFPEGGIPPHYPPALVEFKNGPFRMAIEEKVPIIPVSGPDAWKMLWDDGTKYGTRPGIAHFYVHKPVETAHLSVDDADDLRDRVYEIIRQKSLL